MKTSSRTDLFLSFSSTNLEAVTDVSSSNDGHVTKNAEDFFVIFLYLQANLP